MASIEEKDIIFTMLANRGVYPGDPPAIKIYKYSNHPDDNASLYAAFWQGDEDDIYSSPFCFNIRPLMIDGKLTRYGYQEISKLEKELKQNNENSISDEIYYHLSRK